MLLALNGNYVLRIRSCSKRAAKVVLTRAKVDKMGNVPLTPSRNLGGELVYISGEVVYLVDFFNLHADGDMARYALIGGTFSIVWRKVSAKEMLAHILDVLYELCRWCRAATPVVPG
jgi:hypothetical protein